MDNIEARDGIDNTMKLTMKAEIMIRKTALNLNSYFTVANVLKVIVLVCLCLFIYNKTNQSKQEDTRILPY
jgi:hypothetical protein